MKVKMFKVSDLYDMSNVIIHPELLLPIIENDENLMNQFTVTPIWMEEKDIERLKDADL